MSLFKIDPKWREAVTKHYSAWGLYVAVGLVLLSAFSFDLFGVDLNPIVLTRWVLAALIFSIVGKVLLQTDEGKWIRRAAIAGGVLIAIWASAPALAAAPPPSEAQVTLGADLYSYDEGEALSVAVDLIARWEGSNKVDGWHVSYRDIVGMWTNCYGHTATAKAGQRFSDHYCTGQLRTDVRDYRARLHRHFTNETKRTRLTPARDAAYTSLAYNIGTLRAGRSTAVKRINRGNIRGGCNAIGWWNRAGGRVVFGLVRRRTDEVEMCLRGLT